MIAFVHGLASGEVVGAAVAIGLVSLGLILALERWRRVALKIAIFSSGSTLAQKLLFAHTQSGDVTHFIDDYFDTSSGTKTAMESYRRIASNLGLATEKLLFISDVVAELDAARVAGLQTVLCIRPGNQRQPLAHGHKIIRGFDEIAFA